MAASSSCPKYLSSSSKLLLLLVAALVLLQYLNLLQVNDSKALQLKRSLFTLDFREDRRPLSGQQQQRSVPPLLTGIAEYLEKHSLSSSSVQQFPLSVTSVVSNDSSSSNISVSLPSCPMIPTGLQGPLKVATKDDVPATMGEIEEHYSHLQPGGRYQPLGCTSRHRVAIIVPYRAREGHLRAFLLHMHAFLEKQQLDYGIFVVEQSGAPTEPFNRAMLMNVGAAEALKQHNYQCFVFHDVDLLPEDDRNLYTCPVQPRHMSVAIDSFTYRLPYDDIFGGVSAMTVDHFKEVNGFSNLFWGWGGEDDDMSNRLRQKKLYISRYPANIARYKMLKHDKDTANPERFKYLYSGAKRMTRDGFNSLKYTVVEVKLKQLYTWVLVDLPHLKP